MLALLLLGCLAACQGPLLDQPSKLRETQVFVPPLYTSAASPDGTSWSWDALFWLFGASAEGGRSHARALPFYWRGSDAPFSESSLWFPFYYGRTTPTSKTRFYSLLYGFDDGEYLHTDYVPLLLSYRQVSKTRDAWRSGVGSGLLYDWRHEGPRDDVVLFSLFGLATVLRMEVGYPADGETVPALGRTSSRRVSVGDVLGLVTLFGYDDVGDRREWRVLTLFSNEVMSPIRSWRSRGDDPFVREWLFPLYMNVQDDDGGFSYVGPLWGSFDDRIEGTHTDWWALGLLSRKQSPDGSSWRLLGIPLGG